MERIDKTTFESELADDVVQPRISTESECILTFATSQLTSHQPRDNYQELLDLTILFIEAELSQRVHFRNPGPMHHAR